MKKALALLLAVLMLTATMPLGAATVSADTPGTTGGETFDITIAVTENYDEIAVEIDILNQRRAENGLDPVVLDPQMTAWAMQRAAECAIFYSHTRPDATSCFSILDGDFYWGAAGENIAIGYWDAADVMEGWMDSPGHRANILDAYYLSVGLGCVESDNGTKSWVQLFSSIKGSSHTPSGKIYREDVPIRLWTDWAQLLCQPEQIGTLSVGDTVPYEVWAVNLGFPYSAARLTGGFTATASSDCVRVDATQQTVTAIAGGAATITVALDNGQHRVTATATVTVEGAALLYGDADSNGKVNNRDLGLLQQFLNEWDTAVNLTACDVDKNGKVNNRDLGMLQQYLNEWDIALG